MSSYAYFVQCCREEHKKKHPGENVVFAEFTKKCAQKWKEMNAKEKKRFEEMAEKDKTRYQNEMVDYAPDGDKSAGGRGKKRTKDPNAPKRALSAFFLFCNEERPKVKKDFPSYAIGDVAKELGKRWEKVTDRTKFEKLAAEERKKYEAAMEQYRAGGGGGAAPKKAAPARVPQKKQKVESEEEEDEEEEEEEEDEEDDE